MTTAINTAEQKEEVFEFLDGVRDWGGINMFGAGPLVADSFGVGRREAQNLVAEWMRTFSERQAKKVAS